MCLKARKTYKSMGKAMKIYEGMGKARKIQRVWVRPGKYMRAWVIYGHTAIKPTYKEQKDYCDVTVHVDLL